MASISFTGERKRNTKEGEETPGGRVEGKKKSNQEKKKFQPEINGSHMKEN